MAESSGIAWTRSTFNPWIGCTKVGPGCDHCYAENQDSRKRWGGVTHWGPGVARMRTSVSNWKQPMAWERKQAAAMDEWRAGARGFDQPEPWRVFCASLADVFDNEVDPLWRLDLFKLIQDTPHLSWLLVTKRIGNVAKMMPQGWQANGFPENVRLMITVVNQEEADRDVPKLLELQVKNGVSYEPALGPVDFRPWLMSYCDGGSRPGPDGVGGVMCHRCQGFGCPHLEWVIVGGESAQGAPAREFQLRWARDVVEHCRAAGVPPFVKQLGSHPQEVEYPADVSDSEAVRWHADGWTKITEGAGSHWRLYLRLEARAGDDVNEWPADLRVREFPE